MQGHSLRNRLSELQLGRVMDFHNRDTGPTMGRSHTVKTMGEALQSTAIERAPKFIR